MTILLAWVFIAFATALGWVLGATIHGETEYRRGFDAGYSYRKLVEQGVITNDDLGG